ncbi:Ferric enterobactin transport ATP-binding protein FepC [archaeon HR01]|nr:Ferric enterobactin transport ATP-binding protein FepC [archaeon HR01]
MLTTRLEESIKTHVIELHGVSYTYDTAENTAVEDISFTIERGEFAVLIGPNGAGKSTVLKLVNGLLNPLRGRVRVLGQNPSNNVDVKRKIAYIPQRGEVDWDYPVTVLDVVLMGRYPYLRGLKRYRGEDLEYAGKALETVGMSDFADRRIRDLSGGQQQRVFLARMLAQNPEIYLLDEPLTGLDVVTEDVVIEVLERERRRGKTVVMSTHHLSTYFKELDKIVLLNRRLVAWGPPSAVLTEELLLKTYGGSPTALHVADIKGMLVEK